MHLVNKPLTACSVEIFGHQFDDHKGWMLIKLGTRQEPGELDQTDGDFSTTTRLNTQMNSWLCYIIKLQVITAIG